MPVPTDESFAIDGLDVAGRRVGRSRTEQLFWVPGLRGKIHRAGSSETKGVVWPLEIVNPTKCIKCPALFTDGSSRRDLELERAMEALEPAVLLGFGRSDDLDGDAELEEPDHEPRQAGRPR